MHTYTHKANASQLATTIRVEAPWRFLLIRQGEKTTSKHDDMLRSKVGLIGEDPKLKRVGGHYDIQRVGGHYDMKGIRKISAKLNNIHTHTHVAHAPQVATSIRVEARWRLVLARHDKRQRENTTTSAVGVRRSSKRQQASCPHTLLNHDVTRSIYNG